MHTTKLYSHGVLHVYPVFMTLFEKKKYVENEAKLFPMGNLKLTYKPHSSTFLYEFNGDYGLQRLDKYGLPTEFMMAKGSVAWGKGMDSIFVSGAARQDRLPSGINFTSLLAAAAMQTTFEISSPQYWSIKPVFDLPDLPMAQGYGVSGKLQYNIRDVVLPYSALTITTSEQYESRYVYQADAGFTIQEGVMMKTRDMNRWYEYKVPYQIKLAYQRYWYPESALPTSQTLFLTLKLM